MSWPTFVCAESYSMAALFVAKLSPADVTPVAPASASCTVAAQLAQVIPSIGSTMRVLLRGGGGIVELVWGRGGAPFARRLYHEQSLQHVHPAAEGIFTGLLRCELDRGGLKRRQLLIDAELLEHDALRAVGRLVAIEPQSDRLPRLHYDRVGCVAALHRDTHFLHTARGRGRCDGLPTREQEVPQHPDDGDGAERRDGDLGRRHDVLVSAPGPALALPPAGRRAQFASRRRSARRTPAR